MSKYYQKRDKKLFKPPGSLIYIGNEIDEDVTINFIAYDDEKCEQNEINSFQEIEELLSNDYNVFWIHINGINNENIINQIGNIFRVNNLVLEDIMNTNKRPKVDFYPEYIYSIFKNISYKKCSGGIRLEQISIIAGNNYVITFQEKGSNIFTNIMERVSNDGGNIRDWGANFLFYSLIDYLVDSYFYSMEVVADQIEKLDKEVLMTYSNIELSDLREYKHDITVLRKLLWPTRELIKDIIQQTSFESEGENELNFYYRDIYEHTIELIELLEILQGSVEEIQNLYHTKISHRMNRIMGLLTVISIIFLPLTLIAGIYGMNFKYMPELNLKWGYPAVLLIMMFVAASLVLYFKNKKWF